METLLRQRNTWNYVWAWATPETSVSESCKEFGWNSPLSWGCGPFQHIREPRLSSKTGIILKDRFLLELNGTETNFIQPEHLCCVIERLSEPLSFVIFTHSNDPFQAQIPASRAQRHWHIDVSLAQVASSALFLSLGCWGSPRIVGKQKRLES